MSRSFTKPRAWMLAVVFIAWYLLRLPTRWELDSIQVHLGCTEIVYWFQGRSAQLGWVRAFPLFQYLTGTAVFWLNTHGIPINIFWLWATCSSISLAVIAIMLHRVARQTSGASTAWVILVVVLSGPLIYYAPSTFNELPAAMLILCFTIFVSGSGGAFACAILFWLSGITKEFAPPLLAIVWIAGLWLRKRDLSRRALAAHLVVFAIALVLTLATNAGFNLFRYGTIWNTEYMAPHLLVRPLSRRLQNALALWFSPSGGIVLFWPMIVIVGATAIAWRQRTSAALGVGLLLGVLTAGLSGWYEPLGWWSWGPRLALPWLPAALALLLRGTGTTFSQVLQRVLRARAGFVTIAVLACLSALPHVYAAPLPQVIKHYFDPENRQPPYVPPIQADGYYHRNVILAWHKLPPLLVQPFIEPVSWTAHLAAAGYLIALVLILREARNKT